MTRRPNGGVGNGKWVGGGCGVAWNNCHLVSQCTATFPARLVMTLRGKIVEEKSKQREQFESHPTVGGGGEALRGELNRKMTNLEPALTVFFPQVFPSPGHLTISRSCIRRAGALAGDSFPRSKTSRGRWLLVIIARNPHSHSPSLQLIQNVNTKRNYAALSP